MGEKIKTAREDTGISQEELAEKCYLRRATLSNIENGKSEASTQTFILLAYYLQKPLAYFLPKFMYREIKQEDLKPLEQEALLHFGQIEGDELKKLAIKFIKTFGDYDPKNLVIELAPIIAEEIEREKEINEFHEKNRKKK